MKIIVWGLGQIFERFSCFLCEKDIVCLVDNNINSQVKFANKEVVLPKNICKYEFDYIVIFASEISYKEISYQLIIEMGIDCRKILKWEYYLGKNFYNSRVIANVIGKCCNCRNIKKILDVGGLLNSKQIWNINSEIIVDLLIDSKEIFFINSYRKKYFNIKTLNETYDLILLSEDILSTELIEKLSLYTKFIIFIIPLDVINKIENQIKMINFSGYLFGYIYKSEQQIKIFEVTHKQFIPIKEESYIPIYAGKRGNKIELEYIGDDAGDNISFLNQKINECTALYWIWKNINSDILGLNHYRRFFKSPINNFMLQSLEIELLMDKYDIIVIEQAYDSNSTVEEIIRKSVCQEAFFKSMKFFDKFVDDLEGEEGKAVKYIFQGHAMHPCNMFITSKKILHEYCDWLFPILFKLINGIEIKEYWDDYSKRIIGFIAERLLSVWIIQQNYKVKELPLIVVEGEHK